MTDTSFAREISSNNSNPYIMNTNSVSYSNKYQGAVLKSNPYIK
jgi:hypothetical protein